MASRCNPHLLIPMLSLQLLVLPMTWHSAVTESAALFQLRGEVGGNVAFHCPVDKKKTLAMLYLQKDKTFVNGYYGSRNVSNPWENTRLDLDKTTILMYNLNVSHSGDYRCIIRYDGGMKYEPDVHLHLNVTANYSKPSLSVHCSDQNHPFSCLVQCTSHGGYPDSEATWHIPGSSTVVNNSKINDSHTKTFNISSTANINCSDRNLTSLSCSVGNVSSAIVSVCTPKDPPDTHSPYVIAAAICAVVVVILVVALLWRYFKKGQRRAAAVAVRRENGYEEEVTVLNENTEAS